jgi:hypothetical protein
MLVLSEPQGLVTIWMWLWGQERVSFKEVFKWSWNNQPSSTSAMRSTCGCTLGNLVKVKCDWMKVKIWEFLKLNLFACLTPLNKELRTYTEIRWRCQIHGGGVVPAAVQNFFAYGMYWLVHQWDACPSPYGGLLVTACIPSPRTIPRHVSFKQSS